MRGAINAAWDKLGSSGGALGVPIGDETYDGELATQAFSGGKVSWNRLTKAFTTVPPDLASKLTDLQVPIDPTAAINMAWRAAGGPSGTLGAKQGDQYPVGGDGLAQNFDGGKIFFSPATGANAIESDVLAKYESLGGPGGNLGFPIANEADGGLKPASRVSPFAAADKPVIFWTSDHGAFVVRGAIKAAWDKLDRSDRQTGRAGGRAEGQQRRAHAEVHRWPDRLESGEEHVQHPAGELGVFTVRSAGAGAEDAGRFVDRWRTQRAELASMVVTGRHPGAGIAGRGCCAGRVEAASTPRCRT